MSTLIHLVLPCGGLLGRQGKGRFSLMRISEATHTYSRNCSFPYTQWCTVQRLRLWLSAVLPVSLFMSLATIKKSVVQLLLRVHMTPQELPLSPELLIATFLTHLCIARETPSTTKSRPETLLPLWRVVKVVLKSLGRALVH